METKANYLMIGGFVLGVLAFAFIFVFWMSNFAGGGKRYYVVFDELGGGADHRIERRLQGHQGRRGAVLLARS